MKTVHYNKAIKNQMYYQSYNKYGAKKTVYNGRKYDSKLEARVAQELDLRLKANEFVEVVPQFRVKLYCYLPDGSQLYLWDYICDFRCEKPDGSYLLVEAKGMRTGRFRDNLKLLDGIWLPDHPDYDYEIIQQ